MGDAYAIFVGKTLFESLLIGAFLISSKSFSKTMERGWRAYE